MCAEPIIGYRPESLWSTVGYMPAGSTTLAPGPAAAFAFIKKHAVVPADFETNVTFGPLSGISYEERLFAAYSAGKLGAIGDVCTSCGTEGHRSVRCPAAF